MSYIFPRRSCHVYVNFRKLKQNDGIFSFYLHKSVKIAIFALYSLDFNLYWLSPQLVLGMIKTACIEWNPLVVKNLEDLFSLCWEYIFLNSVISKWVSSVDLKSVKQCRFFTSSSTSNIHLVSSNWELGVWWIKYIWKITNLQPIG